LLVPLSTQNDRAIYNDGSVNSASKVKTIVLLLLLVTEYWSVKTCGRLWWPRFHKIRQ